MEGRNNGYPPPLQVSIAEHLLVTGTVSIDIPLPLTFAVHRPAFWLASRTDLIFVRFGLFSLTTWHLGSLLAIYLLIYVAPKQLQLQSSKSDSRAGRRIACHEQPSRALKY